MTQAKIYSVSQLNQSVRQMLEGQLGSVWLTGEISILLSLFRGIGILV